MAIEVYDADGNEKDLLWAMEKYNVKILATPRDIDHWEVVELRENLGDAAIIVRTKPPQAGIAIRFGSPGESVEQKTEANGTRGFPVGGGSWYHPAPPRGECGPHFVEILGMASDRVECLGMRAPAVNHDHLDVTFSFVEGKEEPEPEPEPECEALRQAAIKARDILDAALGS